MSLNRNNNSNRNSYNRNAMNYVNNSNTISNSNNKSNAKQAFNVNEYLSGISMSKSATIGSFGPSPLSMNEWQQKRTFLTNYNQVNAPVNTSASAPNTLNSPNSPKTTAATVATVATEAQKARLQQAYSEYSRGISMSKSIRRKMPFEEFIKDTENAKANRIKTKNGVYIVPYTLKPDTDDTDETDEKQSESQQSKQSSKLATQKKNPKQMAALKKEYAEYLDGISMSKSAMPVEFEDFIKDNNDDYHVQWHKNSSSYFINMKQGTQLQQASSNYPRADTKIALGDILEQKPEALELLQQCLVARGWCKIVYPDDLYQKWIIPTFNKLKQWLQKTDASQKLKYSRLKPGTNEVNPQSEYSYHCIKGFKEGLRILTGDIYKIHSKHGKYPNELVQVIAEFNDVFEEFVVRLLRSVAKPVYGVEDFNDLGDVFDISVLNGDKSKNGKKLKYSMLDFVNYFNNKQKIEEMRRKPEFFVATEMNPEQIEWQPDVLKTGFNVMEHSDPGLFALSFLSDNDGLEMLDKVEKEWIAIDKNEGIWWNGKLSEAIGKVHGIGIESGDHRIKIDEKEYKPRFTGWYEVSCNFQMPQGVYEEALELNKK